MHLVASKGGGGAPDSYQFHVDKDGATVWTSGWAGGSDSAAVDTPAFGSGDYWWSAKARNAAGEGPNQQYGFHFHINYVPAKPGLSAPADGAFLKSRALTLQWGDPGDPDNWPHNYRDYRIHVWKTDNSWSNDSGWGKTGTTYQVTAPSDGAYRWQVAAGDGADDNGYSGDRGFVVDTGAPTISNVGGPQTSRWYGEAQTVTWQAADATSGVASNVLAWDNGAASAVTPEGKHGGTITVADKAGNQATASVGPFWVDLSAPGVSAALSPAEPDGENGWYRTAPSLLVMADDGDGSGVVAAQAVVDGTAQAYTGPVAIPDGTHTVSGRAVDAVGHTGSSEAVTVRVDGTPPSVSAVLTDAESHSLTALAAAWSGSDGGSGIAEYRYRVGTSAGADDVRAETSAGTGANAYIAGLALADGGTYYVSVRAKDRAGNWSGWVSSAAIHVLPGGGDGDSANLNAGGVSVPATARRSANYMVVDSLGQFAVDISYSGSYVVQSGYWHPDEGTSYLNAYESPNFNAGGVSGVGARISEHYRIVDSLGQFVAGVSTGQNVVVESGYWHSEVPPMPFTLADAARALELAGGIANATVADARLDVVGGASAGKVDAADAATIARKAAGLEVNP